MDLHHGDTQLIVSECVKRKCTCKQAAYILATARWETNHTMKPVEEAYWLSDAWRKKNLRYYPWHGRGYVQLTWERNYIHAGKQLDRDLTTSPKAVMQADIAAEILVVGSLEGWFTGKKLGDYLTEETTDYIGARRVINGTDKAQSIATLAAKYEAALVASGYGVNQDIGSGGSFAYQDIFAMIVAFILKWMKK